MALGHSVVMLYIVGAGGLEVKGFLGGGKDVLFKIMHPDCTGAKKGQLAKNRCLQTRSL